MLLLHKTSLFGICFRQTVLYFLFLSWSMSFLPNQIRHFSLQKGLWSSYPDFFMPTYSQTHIPVDVLTPWPTLNIWLLPTGCSFSRNPLTVLTVPSLPFRFWIFRFHFFLACLPSIFSLTCYPQNYYHHFLFPYLYSCLFFLFSLISPSSHRNFRLFSRQHCVLNILPFLFLFWHHWAHILTLEST